MDWDQDLALTRSGLDALVKEINKGENYQRSVIERDFLQVLANGLASSIFSNKESNNFETCNTD
jgi:hypothetical protein